MKKPLAIDPDVLERLRRLPKGERALCLQALYELCETFGRAHIHSGIGIRKLGRNVFEFRGNLNLRFVFLDRSDSLYVRFLGNHDEVQVLLRKGTV